MKAESIPQPELSPPGNASETPALSKALKESKHVKALLDESTDELSAVNADIKQQVLKGVVTPQVEKVLRKNQAAEDKVSDASDKLSSVNKSLESEVKERDTIEQHLADVRHKEQNARYAAFHDVLTGLPNRALFKDRLEHGLAQATRHGSTLAVMFIDLDRFKSVNDTFGHHVGDDVLRIVAQRLTEITRADDTVSRYGGDEFLVLLTQFKDDENLAAIARKLFLSIEAAGDLNASDPSVNASFGVSIGISIYPRDGTTADALIDSADAAMYDAKKNKSGYAFARSEG